uniref:CUB domain-containing protein n=1 Tax=Arion vulgaris TaxID=1028688 RepID=A0A0B7A098_9EUPU
MMLTEIRVVSCVVIVVLTSLPRDSLCCFPIEDVFADSSSWLQTTSLNSRRLIQVGEEAEDIIIVETEGLATNRELMLRCMIAYGENRYLVKVEEEHGSTRYMCYQFTPLTHYVIRQGRTEENINRKRVDCIDDHYTEDEAVLIAYKDIQPQQCPLVGGYQMIMRQGMAVDGNCVDSVHSYNPHVQFHCDGRGSGNVLVDFGKACEPPALTSSMGGRHLTHLTCVSEWEEDGFQSVLLQMRDHQQSFWCLHYKVVSSGHSSVLTGAYDSLEVFLTVDGRCSSQAFGDEDVPRNTSMFGHLIAYRQETDIRCTEKVYLESCQLNVDKCLSSVECPSYCGRCKKMLASPNCSFPANTLGSWKVVNSDRQLEITIQKTKIKSHSFGDFLCMGARDPDLEDDTYPVLQATIGPTCMPYYACAVVFSPTPGLLTFQLQPSFRNPKTGEPLPCKESHDLLALTTPPEQEEAITLINQNKLHKTACNHELRSTYPTRVPGCKVAVHQCSGTCQTFNVTFDIPSCGNETDRTYDIENKHICYATITFEDGVHGILAKTFGSGRYLCWLFSSTRLFVASPEDCNQESVTQIFSDVTAHLRYDPLSAISTLPFINNSAQTCLIQTSAAIVCVWLLGYILQTLMITNVNS